MGPESVLGIEDRSLIGRTVTRKEDKEEGRHEAEGEGPEPEMG